MVAEVQFNVLSTYKIYMDMLHMFLRKFIVPVTKDHGGRRSLILALAVHLYNGYLFSSQRVFIGKRAGCHTSICQLNAQK